jgi:hypothetical protein
MSNQIPPIDWYARPDSWTYRMPGVSPVPGSWRVPTPPLAASDTSYQSEPTDYSADAPSTQGILGQFSRPINAPTSPPAWNAAFSMPRQLNTEPVNFLPADHPALRIHLPSQVELLGPQAPAFALGLSTHRQTDMAGLPDQIPPRPREEPGVQPASFNPLRLGSNAALRALMRLAPERIVLDTLMATAPSLLTLPQRAFDAAAEFQRDPQNADIGPILEAALLPMGGTFAGAPRAALGAGPTRRLPMDEASPNGAR